MTRLLFAACLLCVTAPASAAEWGSIEGQFILEDDVPDVPPLVKEGDPNAKDAAVCAAAAVPNDALAFDPETKGIANICIYMRRAPAEIHPDLKDSKVKEVEFDQKGCRFLPHAMVVRTDQVVICKSSDPVPHNLHTNPFSNTAENFIVNANDQTGHKLSLPSPEALPVKVNCDIHPWMGARWIVVNHPYAAVTDAQGRFRIDGLPVGEHQFVVWHEEVGYIDRAFKVTVKAGDEPTKLEPIKVPLKAFRKG